MSFNFPDINKEATLDRIYEKTKVTEFCKKHEISRHTLYQVLQGWVIRGVGPAQVVDS